MSAEALVGLLAVLLFCLFLDIYLSSPSTSTPFTWEYDSKGPSTRERINDTECQQHKGKIALKLMQVAGGISEGASVAASKQLLKIYRDSIQPLEQAYKYASLNKHSISEGEMSAKPMILFLGPWSTGKSSIINYLLNIERDGDYRIRTGAEPTTSEFTVVMHGETPRVVKGIQLVADKSKRYTPLVKYGLTFLERFQGLEFNSPLLARVTLVDTPGIIETKRQQARGYPFKEVCQWFIDRAHLIFLVFDPSKLDIGTELEQVFKPLKGHEGKVRVILNKADTVTTQELMRVYGALFWSLSPLINEVEPPRIYVCSLWSEPYVQGTMYSLFEEEEMALLLDVEQTLRYQVEYKIGATRRQAFLVRLHALTVESYRKAFADKKSLLFGNNDKLWSNIIKNPDKFNVYHQLKQNKDVSIHDLPAPETYQHFFAENSIKDFKPLPKYCTFFRTCYMDTLQKAIDEELPNLLQDVRSKKFTGIYDKIQGKC